MGLRLLKMLGVVMISPILLILFTGAIGISAAYDATKPKARH